MRILFLHGWQSVVGGVKPTYLRNAGHTVLNPALSDDDFQLALLTSQRAFDDFQPDVVVGSSRGGALAMNLKLVDTPLVLLCPAWKRWGSVQTTSSRTAILHSRRDDVIPFEDSELLISRSGLGRECLIETGTDHRLADDQSLAIMLWVSELLGSGGQLPPLEVEFDFGARDSKVSSSQCEGAYVCDSCGEEIVIPLDITEGMSQTYVEDCPVCCNANRIHVSVVDEQIEVWAEPEQDRY
ncbi:CPXCG motif-containing cysteine-rich protein [Pirellulaceae bacterium SH449]